MRRRRLGDQRLAQLLDRRETGIQPLDFDDAVGRGLGACQRFAGIAHAPASSNCPSLGTRKKPSRKAGASWAGPRSEEHTSELQSHHDLVCRLLLEKKKNTKNKQLKRK